MIEPAGCKPKRRPKVFGLEIRHLFQDLFRSESGREKIEDIAHADTHAADTWPPAALLRIYRDSFG